MCEMVEVNEQLLEAASRVAAVINRVIPNPKRTYCIGERSEVFYGENLGELIAATEELIAELCVANDAIDGFYLPDELRQIHLGEEVKADRG